MNTNDIKRMKDIEVLFDCSNNNVIEDIYVGDLLSFVMANAKEGCLWLTVQKHINVIAIAELNDFSGIVFLQDVDVDEDVIEKAKELSIPLFRTKLTGYQFIKMLLKDSFNVL